MKGAAERTLVRWIHIGASAAIGAYVYSPLVDFIWFQVLTKVIVIPATAITGFWMWKGFLIRKHWSKTFAPKKK